MPRNPPPLPPSGRYATPIVDGVGVELGAAVDPLGTAVGEVTAVPVDFEQAAAAARSSVAAAPSRVHVRVERAKLLGASRGASAAERHAGGYAEIFASERPACS